MPKDNFEFENELEELEKAMSSEFDKLPRPPLRAEFKNELRNKLREQLQERFKGKQGNEDQAGETQSRLAKTFRFRGGGRRWQAGLSVALVVVLLAGIFWGAGGMGLFVKPIRAAEVNIVALNSDRMGVDVGTAFLLSSKEPLDKKTVQEALKIEPRFDYRLDKMEGGRKYKIIPLTPLSPNAIYTLSFDQGGTGKENMSWAFQTKSKFHVVRSLPAGQTTNVPCNTGIEITFSHDNFDIDAVKDYFSIEPAVEGVFEKHKKTLVFVPKELQPSAIYTVTLKKGLALSGTAETLAQDYVFSFETAPRNQESQSFAMYLDTGLTEFSTADKPVFPVYFHSGSVNTDELPVHIDLYRYPGHEEFRASLAKRDLVPRWSYIAWNQYKETLNPAYKTAGYDTKFLSADPYTHYIAFPETLQPGYYAAEFTVKEAVRQVWFQVSDLSVYLFQGTDQNMFWANDLKTKAPASGVTVSVPSKV
jgi:hypothetical protein